MRGCLRAVAALVALAGAAGAAQAGCKVEQIAELPVTMHGSDPLVAAKINGVDGSFIADSGATFSLISPGMAGAARLRLEDPPEGLILVGLGGAAHGSYTQVKDFVLAGIPLHNINFIVGGSDTGTAGLLGQNVLGIGDVEYDLPGGFIRLFRSHDCGDTALAYWTKSGGTYSELKIEAPDRNDPHTVATITINGTPFRALFDTGASSTTLSLHAAAKLGIKPGDPRVEPAGVARGVGRKVAERWSAHVGTVKIGDEEVRNAAIDIGDFGAMDVDMLIGADFFISHRIYVDNAQHRMFLTYTGGPLFNRATHAEGATGTVPTAVADAREPKDADGFSRRGAVFAAQKDFTRAVADFDRALALAPKEPRYLVQRAEAHRGARQKGLALADLDQAIALDPANLPALIDRAELRVEDGKAEAALADLDAAARAARPALDEHFRIARLYAAARAPAQAIGELDLWIAAHRADSRLPAALNGRCRSRALANRDIDKALDDCNAALRLVPHSPDFLDSRGLVRVRMGEWDKAIADFDEALKAEPKTAWSLYGRGIAERHKGETAAADADIAAARAIAPELPERAKRLGIS